jgi:hypothetical protein
MNMEKETIEEEKEAGDNFEWVAETRCPVIPSYEITIPDWIAAHIGLEESGDRVAFCVTKHNGENVAIMKKAKREC